MNLEFICKNFCCVCFLGLIGVKLHDTFNQENLLIDAAHLVINTFTKFLDYPSSFWSEISPVIDCSSTEPWSYGKEVYRYRFFN